MVKKKEAARKRGRENESFFFEVDEREKKEDEEGPKKKIGNTSKKEKKKSVHRPRDDKRVPCMASDDRELRNNILLKNFLSNLLAYNTCISRDKFFQLSRGIFMLSLDESQIAFSHR